MEINHSVKKVSIAIDGPAGAGKSSIARAAAKKLAYIYVDTGALYRAVGLFATRNGVDTSDVSGVTSLLPKITLELKFISEGQRIFLNGEDVSEAIRVPEMGMCASNVSAMPAVRAFLLDLQRNMAITNNIIMDGRDIATVVLPNADVKIFLTASASVRAKRRYDEFVAKGESVEFNAILADIIKRDNNDSTRSIAPLKQADDAVLVDTSDEDLLTAISHVIRVITQGLDR